MADNSQLGATVVVADTDTLLFTASKQGVVSELTICNTGGTARTFRVAHIKNGDIGDIQNKYYKAYDCSLDGNTSIVICVGLAFGIGDSFLVRANHANVVFNCSGAEKS